MENLNYLTGNPKKYLFDGCKLIYHQQKLQDWLDGIKITPIHIDMGIHKACNIKCKYCYGIKQKKSGEFIPENALLNLAYDAAGLGIKSIAVIGDGEPTLNKGLYPFVEYAKEKNLDVSVATNGLLLDTEKIKRLTSSCVWLRFNVSGVGKSYERIMGARKGAFKIISNVVGKAVKNKGNCTIGLQMVLIPECFDQVIPLAIQAVKWGVDYLVIKQFSDPEEGIPVKFDIGRYQEVKENLKIAEELGNDTTEVIVKWSAMRDSESITMRKSWGFDRCIDLPFIFQISGTGKCYPCGYLFGNEEFCYGDVAKERLRDILASDRYWKVINKVKGLELKELCKGQCRHCETNKFIDRLVKGYTGNLTSCLIGMCGGSTQYEKIMKNPPEHINFI